MCKSRTSNVQRSTSGVQPGGHRVRAPPENRRTFPLDADSPSTRAHELARNLIVDEGRVETDLGVEDATGPGATNARRSTVRVVNERRIARVRLSDMPQDRSGDEQGYERRQRVNVRFMQGRVSRLRLLRFPRRRRRRRRLAKADFTDTAGLLQRQSPFLVRTDLKSDHTLSHRINPREKTENPIICLSPNK